MCNDSEPDRVACVREAAKEMGELVWQLPMGRQYKKLLMHSKTADIANYAIGKATGASIAACFMEEFIKPDTIWIHFDMASPALNHMKGSCMEEGATERVMATVAELLFK